MWNNSKGFTIVELMIATSVFSIILLICATALLDIGKVYNKGIISIQTQNASRSIMDELANQVQFGVSPPSAIHTQAYSFLSVHSFCIGETRYSYAIDSEVVDTGFSLGNRKSPHALWRDTSSDPNTCVPADLTQSNPSVIGGISGTGKEMIPANIRLRTLSLQLVSGNLWKLSLSIVYGDDIFLRRLPPGSGPIISCISTNSGGSYCGISDLSTEVQRTLK